MKKLLILIVAVAIFLHFYPQPKLEAWYNEQKTLILGKFSESMDTKVRLSPQKVFRDIELKFNQFNSEEQTFIKELTSNRKDVVEFFKTYCEDGNRYSPKLHRNNQAVVCDAIKPYQSFF